MTEKLRVLFLEDNELDVELELAALNQEGITVEWDRVDNRGDFESKIGKNYDLIISDYSMPSFDGLSALRMVRERDSHVPFILVSGTLGEETAIETLKAGATDYVLKERLSRLGPVVRRALRERDEQRQRREAEQALRESQRRYEGLVNSIDGIVWEGNAETFEFEFVSRQTERILGYPAEAWTSEPSFWPAHIHEEDRQWTLDLCRNAAREKRSHQFEYRMIAADGRMVWLRDFVSITNGGGVLKARGVMFDVTERKRAESERKLLEQQLLQAQKMESIGRMAGGVAHDFNNLLTAIIGYSQLMLARLGDDDPCRRETEEIMRAGQRAAALTGQLLAFSRRQKIERKVILLGDTISSMIKMIRRIIGEDVNVEVNIDPRMPPIFADSSQVEQVLLNLAVNARDAMPEGGKLTIETDEVELDEAFCQKNLWARPGRFGRLRVSDTGTGMDCETLTRIFEPFFTTKEGNKGTGLGLSVVYGVIQQHEGLINVLSEPGRGTTFEVYFPLHGERAEEEQQEEARSTQGGTETILIAEDEESLRNLTEKVLSKLGYTVLLARDGAEAIAIFEANRHRVDLMLFDIVMPKMGGREAYLRVRARGAEVPIIFMTGYSEDMVESSIAQSFGAPLILKPYDINELAFRIRQALDYGKARRAT